MDFKIGVRCATIQGELVDVVVESVEALENEIARLTPLSAAATDLLRVQTERADKAEAEVERLRRSLKETEATGEDIRQKNIKLLEEVKRLTALVAEARFIAGSAPYE